MDKRVCKRIVNGELFAVIFDAAQPAAAHRAIGRWACDPNLSFGWREAFAMNHAIHLFGMPPLPNGGGGDCGGGQARVTVLTVEPPPIFTPYPPRPFD